MRLSSCWLSTLGFFLLLIGIRSCLAFSSSSSSGFAVPTGAAVELRAFHQTERGTTAAEDEEESSRKSNSNNNNNNKWFLVRSSSNSYTPEPVEDTTTPKQVDDYLEFLDRRYHRMHDDESRFSAWRWLTQPTQATTAEERSSETNALHVLGLAGLASRRLLQKHPNHSKNLLGGVSTAPTAVDTIAVETADYYTSSLFTTHGRIQNVQAMKSRVQASVVSRLRERRRPSIANLAARLTLLANGLPRSS